MAGLNPSGLKVVLREDLGQQLEPQRLFLNLERAVEC
jgi:hypothetical protein